MDEIGVLPDTTSVIKKIGNSALPIAPRLAE